MIRRAARSAVGICLALAACKAPAPPIAQISAVGITPDATGAVSVDTGQQVQLDGSGSVDPRGGVLAYRWSFSSAPAGSHAAFDLPTAALASFLADVPGTYRAQLLVTAGAFVSAPATLEIQATNCGSAAPSVGALAASPSSVGVGTAVLLSAPNLGDADNAVGCALGQTFSYAWTITGQPAGSTAQLNDATSPAPSLVPDRAGDYVAQLVVTDSSGLASAPARITVTAGVCGSNPPSLAPLQASVTSPGVGAVVELLATASDPDNLAPCSTGRLPADGLRYAWSTVVLPQSSHAHLNSTSVIEPSFRPDVGGVYGFQLTVTDPTGLSATRALTLVASSCGSNVPVAFVSAPQSAAVGSAVQLSASISDDDVTTCNLSKSFSYAWSFVAQPTGSQSSLAASTGLDPTFVPDVPGDYTVQLIVTDSSGIASAPVRRTVTASSCGTGAPSIDLLTASPTAPNPGQQVLVSASISDPDSACATFNPARAYLWSMTSRPAGSSAFIIDPTAASVRFTADVPGSYQLSLQLTNAHGSTSPVQTIVIQAGTCGFAAPQIVQATASRLTPDPGSSVTLSATVADADSGAGCNEVQSESLRWFLLSSPAGSNAVLANPAQRAPTFTPDRPGSYLFSVIATDSTGLTSAPAFVGLQATSCGFGTPQVTASPASIGTQPGIAVQLTALPNDPNSLCGVAETFTYQWALLQGPPGSAPLFSSPTAPSPTFTPDIGGDYELQVTVTNSAGALSAPAFVHVTASGCDALGPTIGDISVSSSGLGALATFSAPGAVDHNCVARTPLLYAWSLEQRPLGSSAVLTTPTLSSTSLTADVAGAYQLSLIVTDGAGLSATAYRTLTIAPCGGSNIQFTSPISAAFAEPGGGATASAHIGSDVTFSAQVTDSNGNCPQAAAQPYAYAWSLVSSPVGSLAQLASAGSPSPGLVPDLPGQYQVSLSLIDALGTRAPTQFFTFATDTCGFNAPSVAIANPPSTSPLAAPLNATLRQPVALAVANGGASSDDADPSKCPARFNSPAITYSYAWTIAGAPADGLAQLSSQLGSSTSFIAFAPSSGGQDYQVELRASASNGQSASATATIAVGSCGGSAPTIASVATSVTDGATHLLKPAAQPNIGDGVQLVATGLDADVACGVSIASYLWSLVSAPAGSAVTAVGATGPSLGFSPDLAGSYVFGVIAIASNGLASAPFPVSISTAACRPAIVGPLTASPGSALTGHAVTLDLPRSAGALSITDACVASPLYQTSWRLVQAPSGSSAMPGAPAGTSIQLTPDLAGSYLLQATVTNQGGFSSTPATLVVNAARCGTAAPLLTPGPMPISASPAVPAPGTPVTLSLGGVDDLANSGCSVALAPYHYLWTLIAAPAGSRSTLSSNTAPSPLLVPDLAGTYQIGLSVTDALGNQSATSVLALRTTQTATCGRLAEFAQQSGGQPAFTASQQRYDGVQKLSTSSAPALLDTRVPIELAANIVDPNAACGAPLGAAELSWSIASAPGGSALSGTLASPEFIPDVAGTYSLQLITSAGGVSGTQLFSITTSSCGTSAPAAQGFTANQTLASGAQLATSAAANGSGARRLVAGLPVQLSATLLDLDSEATCSMLESDTLAWSIRSAPAGSTAQLSSSSALSPTLATDLPGTYVLELAATDATGLTGPAESFTLQIDCGVSAPIALDQGALAAFSAQQLVPAVLTTTGVMSNFAIAHSTLLNPSPQLPFYPGLRVQLAANAVDPDTTSSCALPARTISYHWSMAALPTASRAQLTDVNTSRPSFVPDAAGEYDLQLQLSDGQGHSSTQLFAFAQGLPLVAANGCGLQPSTVQIGVLAPHAGSPGTSTTIAMAGDDVALAGTSSDPDNAPLDLSTGSGCGLQQPANYQWQLTQQPARSQSQLTAANTATPHLVPDVDGTYLVSLTASDGARTSAAASLAIVVRTPTSATSTFVSSTPGPITADGTSAYSLVLTINDMLGQPMAQVPAAFAISAGPAKGSGFAGTLSAQSGITDSNGQITVALATTVAQVNYRVTATALHGFQLTTAPLSFIGGPGCQLLFAQPVATLPFGQQQTVSVEVADRFGNFAAPGPQPSVALGLAVDGSPHLDAVLQGGPAQSASGNQVLFANVGIADVGTGYSLRASPTAPGQFAATPCSADSTGSNTSNPFDVTALGPLPKAPTQLFVSSITDTSATISWTPADLIATHYRLSCTGVATQLTSSTSVPESGFAPDSTVTCSLIALDGFGEESPDTAKVTFHTLPPPPTITSTSPADGAVDVPASATITISVSESVFATSSAFSLECPSGSPQAFTVDPPTSTSGSSFTLTPVASLPEGQPCNLLITADQVTDAAGRHLAADDAISFTVFDTPPTVTSTAPADGDAHVLPSAAITVNFSKSVNASSSSFLLDCSGSTTFTTSGSPASSFTLAPTSSLPAGGSCTLTVVASQVTDVTAGKTMAADVHASFTIDAPPTVASTAPANGAVDVPVASGILIDFSEAATATASAFSLQCPSGSPQPFSVSPGPGAGAVEFTLTPLSNLPAGVACAVNVDHTQIADAAGQGMVADYSFGFTVDAAPAVSSTDPSDGATAVAQGSTVAFTFNKSVNVTASAFTLECPSGSPVSFSLAPTPPGGATLFTLSPSAALPPSTTCIATAVASQIADLLGTHLAADRAISFATVPLQATDDTYPETVLGNVSIDSANVSGGAFSVVANDTGISGATISTFDSTSANGGAVAMTTSGANLGQFTYNPPAGFTGSDSFTYTLSNAGHVSTGTVTIPVGGMIWFINNLAPGGGDGRLSSPFNTLAAFAQINDGIGHDPAVSQAIFLYSSGNSYDGPLTLLAGQLLIGQGAKSGTLASLAGVTPPASAAALPPLSLTPPTLAASGDLLSLTSNNAVRGLKLGSASNGTALIGFGFGTLTVSDMSINNSSGAALSLASGTVDAVFTSVSSSGGDHGVYLSNVSATTFEIRGDGASDPSDTTVGQTTAMQGGGTIALNSGGTISSATSSGILLDSCSGNVTLRNLLVQDNAGGLASTGTAPTLVLDNLSITSNAAQVGLELDNQQALAIQHCSVTNNGNSASPAPLDNAAILNATGTTSSNTISNSSFGTASPAALALTEDSGAGGGISFINCSFSNATGASAPTGLAALVSQGSLDVLVTGSQFGGNSTGLFGAHDGAGFSYSATGTGSGSATLTGCTLDADDQEIVVASSSSNTVSTALENNTLRSQTGGPSNAIAVSSSGPSSGLLLATLAGNAIGTDSVANSGSQHASGIALSATGAGTLTASVTNNTVAQVDQEALSAIDGQGSAAMNLTLSGNTMGVYNLSPNSDYAGLFVGGTDPADTGTVCLNVTGNTLNGNASSGAGIAVMAQAGSPTIDVQGYAGSADDASQLAAFFDGANTDSPTPAVIAPGAGTIEAAAGPCPTPP